MDIQELRKQINEIDAELVRCFDERMKVALEIGKYKKEHGLPVFDPARERAVLDKQTAAVDENMAAYVKRLYTTLFDLSRSYQQRYMMQGAEIQNRIVLAIENTPKTFPEKALVACQGVEGAYSQQACEKLFEMPDITYFKQYEGVFQAVESGLCEYGVLPVENSSYGSVAEVYDLMRKHRFHIVRAAKLKINSESNYTRFICIAKQLAIYPGANKMSLMLNVQHKPGALYHMIAKFSALGLNLTKFESRPIAGTDFEFMFYFDLDADVHDDAALQLLSELDAGPETFTYLGSYTEI